MTPSIARAVDRTPFINEAAQRRAIGDVIESDVTVRGKRRFANKEVAPRIEAGARVVVKGGKGAGEEVGVDVAVGMKKIRSEANTASNGEK